jgi:hypothetical protein
MTNSVEASSGRTLSGKCLCGAVEYQVEDQFRYALNCHCSNCRRATGAPKHHGTQSRMIYRNMKNFRRESATPAPKTLPLRL